MPRAAVTASLVMTGVAIGLLLVYAADVAAAMSAGGDHGFLPLNHMQRGIGLGGPSLILPIAAFFLSRGEPSKLLGAMIIASGVLIILGGVVVLANPPPPPSAQDAGRDPAASAAVMLVPAVIELALGGIKIARSR